MILALNSRDWTDLVRSAYRIGTDFTQAKMADFSVLDEFGDRSGDVFDRDGSVNAVLMI
jgi:hypothetical protein